MMTRSVPTPVLRSRRRGSILLDDADVSVVAMVKLRWVDMRGEGAAYL